VTYIINPKIIYIGNMQSDSNERFIKSLLEGLSKYKIDNSILGLFYFLGEKRSSSQQLGLYNLDNLCI
jgi:hypothetical protein